MKPTASASRPAACRGFTLTELLVVITIIATLAAISVPAFNNILKKMTREQAAATARMIVNGVKSYYAEYQKYPLPEGSASGEVGGVRTDELLTGALLATDLTQNPKKIRFLAELRDATETGKNGLKVTGDMAIIVDPWGSEYFVIMDSDYNGEIDNPNPGSGSPKLYQTVLVYSPGPDKDPATWEDNILSWATGKQRSAEEMQQQASQ